MSHSHSHANHGHSHTHGAAEDNRSHWNQNAATYNTQFSATIQQIIEEIKARAEWIGVDWVEDSDEETTESSATKSPKKTVRLLDYACGTGLVSRALASHVSQCVGVDISEGMVAEYNKSASNQGIPSSEMEARVGNLLDASNPSPASLSGDEFFNFDIAVVGLGFHHFEDPTFAAKQLALRLKPGGVLLIIDFMTHAHVHDHANPAAHTITHHGFSEEEVKKMFVGAGAGSDFEMAVVGNGVVFKGLKEGGEQLKRTIFMARGVKL